MFIVYLSWDKVGVRMEFGEGGAIDSSVYKV